MKKHFFIDYTPFIGLGICALLQLFLTYKDVFGSLKPNYVPGPNAKLDSFSITVYQVQEMYESGDLTRDLVIKIVQLRILPFILIIIKTNGRFNQAIKCYNEKSAKNLSLKYFFFDSLSNLLQMAYCSYHGFHILLYGDCHCYFFVNSIIVFQLYWYKQIHWKQAFYTISVGYLFYILAETEVLTDWIVGVFYAVSGVMSIYSRTVQVQVIFDAQDYGSLYVGQFLICIATTIITFIIFLVEGAGLTVLAFTFNIVQMNAMPVLQYFIYVRRPWDIIKVSQTSSFRTIYIDVSEKYKNVSRKFQNSSSILRKLLKSE